MAEKEYIDREAALAVINKQIDRDIDMEGFTGAVDILDGISSIPAADVEPVVHSGWEYSFDDLDDGNGIRVYPHCYNCGRAVYRHDAGERCCRCGARMDGGRNESIQTT